MRLADTDRREQLDRGECGHPSLVARAQPIIRDSNLQDVREPHDYRTVSLARLLDRYVADVLEQMRHGNGEEA